MAETDKEFEPKPKDPELLDCQIKMKQLCYEILSLKPESSPWTFWDIATDVATDEVLAELDQSKFRDLLLNEGDSLSVPEPSDYYPDLNMYVGQIPIKGVSVRAWGWDLDNSGSMYQLDISIHYATDDQYAVQTIGMQTNSVRGLPSISRHIWAAEYAETGYDAHNAVGRDTTDETEVADFVNLAEELFRHRKI